MQSVFVLYTELCWPHTVSCTKLGRLVLKDARRLLLTCLYAFVMAITCLHVNNTSLQNLVTIYKLRLPTFFLLLLSRRGWLIDATIRFPMQTKKNGCGNKIGIIGSSKKQNKGDKSNAWCYLKWQLNEDHEWEKGVGIQSLFVTWEKREGRMSGGARGFGG